jgi:membrane-associated protein
VNERELIKVQAIKGLIDFILHLDTHLLSIVTQYGTLTYLILFSIIFFETGLVILPFLPGDSLLFVAGTIAAQGSLNIGLLILILFISAVVGDGVNYSIGKFLGPKVFENQRFKLINKKHLQKAQDFYDQKGAIFIVLARFIPIVRTFAPFVAGVSKMKYKTFIMYNIIGAALWVTLMTLAGFFFGNIPVVKENFSLVTIAIIVISLIPVVKGLIQSKLQKSKS